MGRRASSATPSIYVLSRGRFAWGTPLADLVVRVRREVSEGLNASLGTNWDPETIVVQLGSLPVRTDPLEGTP